MLATNTPGRSGMANMRTRMLSNEQICGAYHESEIGT
ncbi:hypothetical protein ACVMB0_000237 [Bradyrhizobium sp. USDA 4451]